MAFIEVFARTWDGNLYHTRRWPGGEWQHSFGSLSAQVTPGAVADAACATSSAPTIPIGVYLLVAQTQHPVVRLLFLGNNGWNTVPAPNFPNPSRVAITIGNYAPPASPNPQVAVDARLQMAAVSTDGGIYSAIQANNPNASSAAQVYDVEQSGAGNRGDARAVALGDLEVTKSRLIAAYADGQIYESIGGEYTWTPFRRFDVDPPAGPGQRPGDVVDVTIPQWDSNVVGITTSDGRVYATWREAGSWSSWINLEVLLFTIFDVGTFTRLDMSTEPGASGVFNIFGVTSNGRVWYQSRLHGAGYFSDLQTLVGAQLPSSVTAVCSCT